MIASAFWFAIVIRCEQSSDTCTKHETAHPSEAACNAANLSSVERIGRTNDIVIAYCIEDSDQ